MLLENIKIFFPNLPNIGKTDDVNCDGIVDLKNSAVSGKDTAVWGGSDRSRTNFSLDLGGVCTINKISISLPIPDGNHFCRYIDLVYINPEDNKTYCLFHKENSADAPSNFSFSVETDFRARFLRVDIGYHSWTSCFVPQVNIEAALNTAATDFDVDTLKELCVREFLSVDKYGQCCYIDWDNKIKTDEQLKRELADEKAALENFELDKTKYDKYGGILEEQSYKATGFFRLTEIDGCWWFITPEGHKYLMKGIDLACYQESGYYTPLYKPGTKEKREAFGEVAAKSENPSLYETKVERLVSDEITSLSFIQSNLTVKYGRTDFEHEWEELTEKRLQSWNFNCLSKWGFNKGIKMPYVISLRENSSFRYISWALDPFDPSFEKNIIAVTEKAAVGRITDPWLVGYHFSNEAGWDREIVEIVLSEDKSSPAKCAFVDFLKERYKGNIRAVNRTYAVVAKDFDELADTKISINDMPEEDFNRFAELAGEVYCLKAERAIKSVDPNHLFLGLAVVPYWRSCYHFNVGCAKHCDALSFDLYTDKGAWLNCYSWLNKPLLNLEFSFTSTAYGHKPFFTDTHCYSQKQRGEKYDSYVRDMFSVPQFVGSGFFILYDQPVTGRENGDGSAGECFNFGLLNMQDQPYNDMLEIMTATNASLEEVHDKAGI